MPPDGGRSRRWQDWAEHVLAELERLSSKQDDIQQELTSIREAIAELKVKAGIWGLIGGAIPVTIGFVVWAIQHFVSHP